MDDWQNWVDAALAALAAAVVGWTGGRRALRKKLGDVLGGMVVSELAKVLAPVLAPLLTKPLRQAVREDVRALLLEERQNVSEDLGNALAVQRMALLKDFEELLRAKGATRAEIEALRDRVAKNEGAIDVLTEQNGH